MWNQMTLVKVSYSPRVCRCVDFSVFVFRREILSFILTKRGGGVNIQTWGGEEILDPPFSTQEQTAASANWPLWESQRSCQARLFSSTDTVHRGSWRCRHTASKRGREGGFYFSFLCSSSSRNFFLLIDSITISTLLRFWEMEWSEGAGNVSARSTEGAPQHLSFRETGLSLTCVWLGVKLLGCRCWTDRVTVGGCNGDHGGLQAGSLIQTTRWNFFD